MAKLPLQYRILLGLTLVMFGVMCVRPSQQTGWALCITIIALQVESYLDSIRYKKNEEIRKDIETLAKGIDDIALRTAKLELKHAFTPGE